MRPIIYVKPHKRTSIIKKPKVYLKDIAEITSSKKYKRNVEEICFFRVPDLTKKKSYVFSIIDMIAIIQSQYPEVLIMNLGEEDFIIHYVPKPPKSNKWFEALRVAVICLIIFAGTSIAIMAYHTDTSLGKTFMTLNKVFTGTYETNPLYITIPYALGIPVGTLTFFNHIGKRKLSEDPTPIQVEIDEYEDQIENTIISNQSSNKGEGG